MMRKTSLTVKMLANSVVMILLVAVCGGVAYWGTARMMHAADEMQTRYEHAVASLHASYYALEQYREQADAIINLDPGKIEEFEKKAKEMDKYKEKIVFDTAEEKGWGAELDKADAQFDSIFNDEIVPIVREMATADEARKAELQEALRQHDEESDQALEKVLLNSEKIADSLLEEATAAGKKCDAVQAQTRLMILFITVISAIAGLALGFLLTRAITAPINRIIGNLTGNSEQVSTAANQVSAASQQLAEGASEQAASVEEASSSMEEMASMTRQNSDNAEQATRLAAEAKSSAEKGNEATVRMQDAIAKISESSALTQKIIKTIDEIAFQTNLLALNAAVEAARAGEAGKGFAVVAEEVRNLAQRSAEAAKNTQALIEESVGNTGYGVKTAGELAAALGEIGQNASRVNDLVGEIAAASKEQTLGIEQVSNTINMMDKITQNNASNAEESASSAEELSAQAIELESIVDELAGIIKGAAAAESKAVGVYGRGNDGANRKRSAEFHRVVVKQAAERSIGAGGNKGNGRKVLAGSAAARAVSERAITVGQDREGGFEEF